LGRNRGVGFRATLARGGKVGRCVVGSVHLGLRVFESSSRIMAPPDDEECVVEGLESTWEPAWESTSVAACEIGVVLCAAAATHLAGEASTDAFLESAFRQQG